MCGCWARAMRAKRAPTVAVELDRAAEPVSEELGRNGIACWAGDFYAVRPLQALGIDREKGVLRMSAVHYTSAEEVSAADRGAGPGAVRSVWRSAGAQVFASVPCAKNAQGTALGGFPPPNPRGYLEKSKGFR
jgi:hypothetical protein